jgi:hypothetical protein
LLRALVFKYAREQPAVAIATTISDTIVFVAGTIRVVGGAVAMVASTCSAMNWDEYIYNVLATVSHNPKASQTFTVNGTFPS